jgi:hypothetical protein
MIGLLFTALLEISYVTVVMSGGTCSEFTGSYYPSGVARAIAIINGKTTSGSLITGSITFTQLTNSCGLTIAVNLTGLDAGQGDMTHGLHVHQYGIQVVSSDVTTSKLPLFFRFRNRIPSFIYFQQN